MKRLVFVVLAVVWAAVPTRAVDGRDFAGRYDLKSVTTRDQSVSLTFLVDVQNVSGTPLTGVTFEVDNAATGPIAVGPFDLENTATVRFSLGLSVDTATYTEWSAGGARMTGKWTDAEGNTQKRVVELTRIVTPEEVQ